MTNTSAVPDPFARQHRNWAQWFGPEWEAVRAATVARAHAAMERWELVDAEPFGSGGVGYVYRARRRSGEAVVLKVEPTASAWAPQGADRALAVWARAGLAPRVLAARDDGRTLLLDRVTPGTQLGARTASIDKSFPVIADMARQLRAARRTAADGRFPTISEHAEMDGWRPALRRHRPDAVAELDALLALPATTLIHNDLYQDNLLQAGDRWVVIDPKPVLADPHAECFAFLAAAEHVTDAAVVDRYAQAAGLPDPQLLARWVRIRAITITAQRSDSERPTADSARWDAHLQALARMLEPASR
jgi:aminoglycoside/hydroxyurea antibiotic resistance kinase